MAIRRNNKNNENEEEIIEAVVAPKTSGDSTQDFFEKNKVAILGGIAAIIILAIAFSAYKYAYKMPREKAASEELVYAEKQFLQDSFDLALENPGGGFEGLLGIIDSYGGTKAGNLAKYYAGVSYLNLGRFEDAISYMKDFKPSGSFTPIMKHGIIGDAYGELQDFDSAISAYKKAISNDNELLTPYYANKLAVLMMKQGDSSGAKKYFEMIKKDYPTSNESASAAYYLN
jgi:tetratricopeptide (TPR) repeat protein